MEQTNLSQSTAGNEATTGNTVHVVSPPADPSYQTPGRDIGSVGEETLLAIRDAIEDIGNYEFDKNYRGNENNNDNALAIGMMMMETSGSTELPKLRTEKRPYAGKRPNPISIGTARRLLAAAYARILSELDGAGTHGYAWMVEAKNVWLTRRGTAPVVTPTMPKRVTTYDLKARWEYKEKMKDFTLYNHLVQEGATKIIEWFGKALFMDLYEDEILPQIRHQGN